MCAGDGAPSARAHLASLLLELFVEVRETALERAQQVALLVCAQHRRRCGAGATGRLAHPATSAHRTLQNAAGLALYLVDGIYDVAVQHPHVAHAVIHQLLCRRRQRRCRHRRRHLSENETAPSNG